MTSLHCTKCRESKPETDFYPAKSKRGRQNWCKDCMRTATATKNKQRNEALKLKKEKDRTIMAGLVRTGGGWKRPTKAISRVFKPKATKCTPDTPKTSQNSRKGPKKRPRRTRIRAMSQEKRDWSELYKEKLLREPLFGYYYDLLPGDVVVRRMGSRMNCEPHHCCGRARFHILVFRWVTPALHRAIHDRGRWAREQSLILRELEGRESPPDAKDPFNALPELEELKKHYEL